MTLGQVLAAVGKVSAEPRAKGIVIEKLEAGKCWQQ